MTLSLLYKRNREPFIRHWPIFKLCHKRLFTHAYTSKNYLWKLRRLARKSGRPYLQGRERYSILRHGSFSHSLSCTCLAPKWNDLWKRLNCRKNIGNRKGRSGQYICFIISYGRSRSKDVTSYYRKRHIGNKRFRSHDSSGERCGYEFGK